MTKQLEFLTVDPTESSRHSVYIVAIGWLYVVIMMAVMQPGFLPGVMTLIFYGILPLGLILWIVGTPRRRRKAALTQAADEKPDQRD